MLRNEFAEFWREITMLGFGVLFITHSKERATEMKDENGEPITAVAPDLPSSAYSIINSIVDIIGYLQVQMEQDGTSKRYLYTRATPTIFAGSRYQYLAPKIEFGYNELVNAIGDAIDKSIEIDGAEVTDKTNIVQIKARPFKEVLEEAKNIWESYLNGAKSEEEKEQRFNILSDIKKKIFGATDFKLSLATPSQSDLIELFVDEVKDIMNESP